MTPRLSRLVEVVALGLIILAAPCTAVEAPDVAYIYGPDTVARDSFGTMLWFAGFDVTTVAIADVETHDFATNDLIVIGRDTGTGYSWGTPLAVANVVASNLPVIGLATGGTAFFHQLGLYISYGQCMVSSSSGVVVEDPGHALWNNPDPIPIEPDGSVAIYTNPSDGQLLYMGTAPAEVTCYGRVIGHLGYCGITSEEWTGPFAALWSLQDLPDDMTTEGRNLFSNLVWHGLDPEASIFADGFETGDMSRWVTPVH